MPMYEYECQSCHKRTEKIQKFSDPELTVCPHCGGRLERTITAPAVQFAGGGWYKDLYSSTPKPSGSSGSSAASGSTESSGASTSAAPAATPAPAAPSAPAKGSSN